MNRRQFLAATSIAGLGAFGLYNVTSGAALKPEDLKTLPRLQMPPLLDARSSRSPKLIAQEGSSIFIGNAVSQTYGFNQSYLGPTLLLEKGEFRPLIENRIPIPVSVHWHGLVVPGDVDGGPHNPVRMGETWTPDMMIDQPPATLWYHTHIHRRTAQDVYRGLAGVIHLTDGRDEERGLPNRYGVDDLTLVLQDRRFDANGHMTYELTMPDLMHGFTGDRMLVNGQHGAVGAVPKGIVRLRLINGSNARIYSLFFEDNRAFQLIATDAGFLARPATLSSLPLSPGERAEILVDFSDGHPAMLKSGGDPNQGPGGMMGRMMGLVDRFIDRDFPILPFAVDESLEARIVSLPDQLDGADVGLRQQDSVKTRSFSLDMGMMGMMAGGGFAINGEPFAMGRINHDIALGSTEIWRIFSSLLAHPFHIHGASFKVISENGRQVQAHNKGLKDTVLVQDQIELLIRFDKPASHNTPFMYHCHILEHEDAGMMGQFAVV